MSEPLLSSTEAITLEIAKWHFELLCELNPSDPVCATRVWEKAQNIKLIKLMGQPAATAQIGKPATPPADYDTVFECDGKTITLTRLELAKIGTAYHFGRKFSMLDLLAEDFAQMVIDKGPREMIVELKGAAGEVMD